DGGCVAGDDSRACRARHGLAANEGPIVDRAGRELGRHAGHWGYTPGQRKGLGISASTPLFVLDKRVGSNAVIVGPREELGRRRVSVRGRLHVDVARADAKLRYGSPAVPASVEARP